uniref:TSA: Wollemia nobilis Ref_Wollemi_Transcript_22003_940 transcribed RNA sequence n=1 Tax=Wollemia nobilis TaxID=56998 RepID=A0A0C9RHG3_9CONI
MSLWGSRHNQILELRSGQSESTKEVKLATNWSRGPHAPPILVLLDDDDDDVVVSSSRSFAQSTSVASQQSGRQPIITDEDLELRLGFAATTGTVRTSADNNARRKNSRVPVNNTIDLCDEVGETNQSFSRRRKNGQQLGSDVESDESKEVKLTCPICMSTMEEETSTPCGHIFCKKCITSVIQLQKKCPTCRKKVTSNQIHRIYLFSSTG